MARKKTTKTKSHKKGTPAQIATARANYKVATKKYHEAGNALGRLTGVK